MRKSQITVGLFDSGVGGLSVLRQLESYFASYPEALRYRFLYLGDTARLPYGNRSKDEIKNFVQEIISWLIANGADTIVMACNTSAALAGSFARSISTVPVYDLIGPTAEHIAKSHIAPGTKIGVLATNSTVKSQAFSKAIKQFTSDLDVLEIACPELVGLVESGNINSEATAKTLVKYADQLEQAGVDAVVLGCTHYPFLAGALSSLLPSNIQLIDPAAIMVRSLAKSQVRFDTDHLVEPEISKELYVTGQLADFAATAEVCLGQSPGTIYGITVQDLQAVAALDLAAAQVAVDKVI